MGKYTHQEYNIEPRLMSRFGDLGLGKVYYCFHPVIEVCLFFLCIERIESFFLTIKYHVYVTFIVIL